jgi:hypothetical protein
MWNDPDPEKYPGLKVFKEMEERDYRNMNESVARVRQWRAEDAEKAAKLEQLKAAVSMGLDLADYDARLQQSRMKRKLEAEKAAKLEEEEKP